MIRSASAVVAAAVLFSLASFPPTVASAQDRAQEVLAQARGAIGDKGKLDGVSALAVNATVRRVVQALGRELSSDVQAEFLLPDRYRRTETISFGSISRAVTMGLAGDQLLYDDGGAAAMMGTDPTAPGPQRTEMIKTLRSDAARLLTTWLLSPGAGYTFASGGVAEAPEGTADILDVKGPEEFALRLFLDTKTHRLLMATYQNKIADIDKEKLQALQADVVSKVQGDPKKMGEVLREAMEKLPKKTVTVQINVSDFRTVGGLSLPHQMTVGTEGQGQEEWTISSFKVNPPLKPERFEKK